MNRGLERIRALSARLARATVWDPSLLQEVPQRFRPIYTVVLPVKYLLFAAFGFIGTLTIVPSVADATSVDYGDIWTAMVGLTGLVCLAGIIWRREQLELYSLIALTIGFSTYPISAGILWLTTHDLERAALAVGLWVFLILPMWRISDLVRVIRRRREATPSE